LFVLLHSVWLQGQSRLNLPVEEIHINPGNQSEIQLPHRYIIPSNFTIFADSMALDSTQYSLDAVSGRVTLYQNFPRSQLTIRYSALPVSMPATFRHFSVSDSVEFTESEPDSLPEILPADNQASDEELSSNLQRSGSIFRGITLGTNQGLRLQSGLRLQLSGQIVPGVEVTASLTDQNTPIQPEGNTQTLQEIDKVYVQIKTRSLQATMGDFVFDTGPSGFGSYSRKLQGAMGTAQNRNGSVTLIGAASKGQFNSNHFQGQEGNQGPYQLTGLQQQQDIIVLAGTERVWIDGEPMVRGEDNDYIIEYATGQITFTRNRLITSDSRITVDFEYSDFKFQKSIYGAAGQYRLWDDRLLLKTTWLRELDDKDNPLDVPLTDTDREILKQAGDQADSAVTSGARLVGDGKGNYREIQEPGRSVFKYVGEGEGDTAVRFTYVGDGKGDYSFQGYGIYQYEGSGRGSYLPSIRLPMARLHQVFMLQSDLTVSAGVNLVGEMGLSDLDLNLYSDRDDNDNIDRALQGELRVTGKPVLRNGKLGKVDFSMRLRDVGDHFRPVGRMADVEYGRKWGTGEGIYWGERLWEMGGRYSLGKALTVGGEAGDFSRGEFRSRRRQVSAELRPARLSLMTYQAELIRTENPTGAGQWLRQKAQIQQTLGMWTPSVRYEGEHRRDEDPDSLRTGFRFDEWGGKLAFQKGILSGFFGETQRNYQKYRTGHLEKESVGRIDEMQWQLSPGTHFSTAFKFTHRNRTYEDPASEDQRSDLADVRVQFSPWNRSVDGQINYQFSSTRVSELVRDTIQVQTGLGNYRFDENLQELVPDQDGDLLVRLVQTGRFTPVNDLKGGLDIRWDGSKLWKVPRGWQQIPAVLQTRTLYRVERRDSERDFARVNRMSFSPRWGRDSTLVTGQVYFNQDVEIFPKNRDFSIRFRYKQNDSEDNQLLKENLVRHLIERGFRVKGKTSGTTGILLEAVFKTDSKTYMTRSFANRDIIQQEWTGEVSYRPEQSWELALKTQFRTAKDRAADPFTEANAFFWVPRISYAIRGRGHLRAETEIGRVAVKPENRSLPYEMLSGDQPGRTLRWNLLLTYRLSGHMMGTLNYRARKEPWRDRLYQTGQVEVRAFF
jgi:hypothetical protein